MPPGARHAGAGHQRHVHFAGRVVDMLRVLPVVGQMLVDEHRHHAAAGAKLAASRPRSGAGILVIAGGRERIVAVLGNQQHAVDRQLSRAQGQGVGNVVVDRKTVRRGQQPAGLVGRLLVGVQRNQPQAGELALAVERIGQQQAADDHVGVRVVAILGDDRGHGFGGRIVGPALPRNIASTATTMPERRAKADLCMGGLRERRIGYGECVGVVRAAVVIVGSPCTASNRPSGAI